MESFQWTTLLRPIRLSIDVDGGTSEPPQRHPSSAASPFSEDMNRICFSAAFRRLQAKTQAQPFPKTDYVRTRLTHTIEATRIGDRLAREIVANLTDFENALPGDYATVIPEIVSAACLAHDIGNPPFGHVGEYAIRAWFRENLAHPLLAETRLDPVAWRDYEFIDGNAMGLRVLTKLQGWRKRGGLQLTYPVLAAFTKYPHLSSHASTEFEKFGILATEATEADIIFQKLGLSGDRIGMYRRHPLSYLVEAADDIAYLVADIEDAAKHGVLSFSQSVDVLYPIAHYGRQLVRYHEMEDNNDDFADSDRINYLRSGAIDALVTECASTFLSATYHNKIMTGTFTGDLLTATALRSEVLALRTRCTQYIYNEREKCESEAAACEILATLMTLFANAVFDRLTHKGKYSNIRNQKICGLFPKDNRIELPNNARGLFQFIVDFVCNMTDTYAVQLYQKLTGISISGYSR